MMAQLYGHRWVSSYGEMPDPLGVWRATLRGVSKVEMRKGFSRLVQEAKDWPPSAPEFAAMCKPTAEDYGMPPLDEVTDRIVGAVMTDNRVKVHQMAKPVYAVWRELGDTYNFRLADEQAMRKKIRQAYDRVSASLLAGGELPEVPLPLPPVSHKPASREKAIERMAALRGALQ